MRIAQTWSRLRPLKARSQAVRSRDNRHMPKQKKSFEDWYAACIKEADKAVPLSEKTWDVNDPGAMRTLYDRGWSVKKAVAVRIATGDLGKMFDVLEQTTREGILVKRRK